MYIARANGKDSRTKNLNDAIIQIFGIRDAIVYSDKRIIAYWCSARSTVQLPGLTIDISALRSVFANDGYSPQWSGKVTLTLIDGIDRTETVVTANWRSEVNSWDGLLVDFEGESEDPTLYEACELYASQWSASISDRLSFPSYWDAHANDIADRKAKKLPPFDKVA